ELAGCSNRCFFITRLNGPDWNIFKIRKLDTRHSGAFWKRQTVDYCPWVKACADDIADLNADSISAKARSVEYQPRNNRQDDANPSEGEFIDQGDIRTGELNIQHHAHKYVYWNQNGDTQPGNFAKKWRGNGQLPWICGSNRKGIRRGERKDFFVTKRLLRLVVAGGTSRSASHRQRHR